MQSWPKVNSGQVGVGSNIVQNTHLASRKSYLIIIFPNLYEKLTKDIPFLPIFILMYLYSSYLALFTYIYPYLTLFGHDHP